MFPLSLDFGSVLESLGVKKTGKLPNQITLQGLFLTSLKCMPKTLDTNE